MAVGSSWLLLKRYPTPISHLTESVVPLQKSDNHRGAWVEALWQAIKWLFFTGRIEDKTQFQCTVSIGFTVFPQSNGSQHRATPPKLTLSSVRISVLGIWVSAIQEAEGPEILLQISSEQPLGQWNIMHQMLTEPRVKIFNARAVCRRFNRRNTNIGLNVKLRRGPQLTVWLHTGTTREHGLGGTCQVTGPEHEEDTGTIATTHSTTHPSF